MLTPVQNDTPKRKDVDKETEKDKPTRRLIKVDFSVLQVKIFSFSNVLNGKRNLSTVSNQLFLLIK